jgi:hypothetical protein
MMRLPARLIAKLAKARIARSSKSAPPLSLVQCVDAAEILHSSSAAPVSHEKMQKLMESPSPVIWIGGSEPLLHSGISHFVRAIGHSGHFVFLETDGILLRRRIHEFQSHPQLLLAVHLETLNAPDSAFAVEGLRAARLSGFFTVIHTRVREDSDLAALRGVRSSLLGNDVDGWLVTAASADPAVACKAVEARRLIPGLFWRQFSRQVEQALLAHAQSRELHGVSHAEEPPSEAREESVEVA